MIATTTTIVTTIITTVTTVTTTATSTITAAIPSPAMTPGLDLAAFVSWASQSLAAEASRHDEARIRHSESLATAAASCSCLSAVGSSVNSVLDKLATVLEERRKTVSSPTMQDKIEAHTQWGILFVSFLAVVLAFFSWRYSRAALPDPDPAQQQAQDQQQQAQDQQQEQPGAPVDDPGPPEEGMELVVLPRVSRGGPASSGGDGGGDGRGGGGEGVRGLRENTGWGFDERERVKRRGRMRMGGFLAKYFYPLFSFDFVGL
ncbi:hypothetical protein QBC40DRAFT_299226 [Triangularia verruculosa]|uniref:Transmembrane protein n=1 Tax=Triangularia verruculosa TaxID=2587418 RepID=A0AAN6XBK3_9PEZI|nr:hypothetical protein QBC40DRAFT_299226 [Triangularia verruculosa]